MTENKKQSNADDLYKEKEVAFYSAIVEAWKASKMEKDKSLLTLSAGGVGLTVTLLVNFGVKTQCELICYMTSIAGFLISIFGTLFVFERNTKHLEAIIQNDEKNDPLLEFFDKLTSATFLVGVLFLVFAGSATVFRSEDKSIIKKETRMCDKTERKIINDSFNTMATLRPQNPSDGEKSLNGMTALRPTQTETSQAKDSSK